jgi:hypothetical protein
MYISPLRKLLKDDRQCNPFNDSYDFDVLIKKVSSEIKQEEFLDDPLRYMLKVSAFMNVHYKDYYMFLKESIQKANISFHQLTELLFAIFNRNYLILFQNRITELKEQQIFNQNDFYTYKIETLNKGIGKVEANSALELEVDAFNYLLNYLRYYKDEDIHIDRSLQDVWPIERAKGISIASAMFALVKEEYDNSVWNNGYWKIQQAVAMTIFNIEYPDEELLIISKVGLIRMQKNISSNFFNILGDIKQETFYGKFIYGSLKKLKREKRIKDVNFNQGFIEFRLAKGFGKKDSFIELRNTTELISFYSFLNEVKMPKLGGLQLVDLVNLFSLLQDLLQRCITKKFDDSIFSISDIDKFPVKIKRNALMEYFRQRTEYSGSQINTFMNLICHKFGDRINLWDRPLVQFEDSIYINFLPTLNPILLNLIDYWLDQGGFSLDERGKLMEKYLTDMLFSTLKQKKYKFQLPETSKLYNQQKKYEEVDLVVNLRDVVLVAEAKCIKYPMEARDRHNAMKRLHIAAKQVKRKVEFIKKYSNELAGQIGVTAGKSFLPLIITNYPIYTTHKIDGVTVTDFYLFESYFRSGKFTDAKMYQDGTTEVLKEHYYYKSETQMNENLDSFFQKPLPVESLKALFHIVPLKVSIDDIDYEIFVTSAQMKDK